MKIRLEDEIDAAYRAARKWRELAEMPDAGEFRKGALEAEQISLRLARDLGHALRNQQERKN